MISLDVSNPNQNKTNQHQSESDQIENPSIKSTQINSNQLKSSNLKSQACMQSAVGGRPSIILISYSYHYLVASIIDHRITGSGFIDIHRLLYERCYNL
jgi:hypothetical protein